MVVDRNWEGGSLSCGTHTGDGSRLGEGSGRFYSGIMWDSFLRCVIDGSYTTSLKMILFLLAISGQNLLFFFILISLTFLLFLFSTCLCMILLDALIPLIPSLLLLFSYSLLPRLASLALLQGKYVSPTSTSSS
ncbi:hypothetical protein BGX38DRAFT_1193013 [Terfezia claveryi]|nr:hypothetical protein BGX38DRAFT_1193013 [Terfezia claveryi]